MRDSSPHGAVNRKFLLESSVLWKGELASSCRVGPLRGPKHPEKQGIEGLQDSPFPAFRSSHEECWVSFMVKLLRAYGGCLGANRR